MLNLIARSSTGEDYEPQVAWAKELFAATEPFQSGGTYVNFLTDEGQARDAYEPETFQRLQALKAEYDPRTCSHSTRTSRRRNPPQAG